MARRGTRKMKRYSRVKRGGGFFDFLSGSDPQYTQCKQQCDAALAQRKQQGQAGQGQGMGMGQGMDQGQGMGQQPQGGMFGGRRRRRRMSKKRRSSRRR